MNDECEPEPALSEYHIFNQVFTIAEYKLKNQFNPLYLVKQCESIIWLDIFPLYSTPDIFNIVKKYQICKFTVYRFAMQLEVVDLPLLL